MGKKIIYAVDEESGGVTSWSPEANGGSGSDGLSAYEVAVNNGFTGTQQEWLDSLKGEAGEQGQQGQPGIQGAKGDKGDPGEQGIQGIKGDKGDPGDPASTDWDNLTNKPTTFPPSAHTHPISEVSNLQTALDSKAETNHSHSELPTTGQKNALAGTQGTPGTTNQFVTNQDTRLSDARTPSAHSHPQSEITNLVSDLAGKAPSNHNHDSAYAPLNHTHAPTYAVLANGATTMALATNNTVKVTPTANATYTTTVPPAGTICYIIILTSGTTSRTITFGTGFKPTATLATGTVSGRVFVVGFISDGTNLYEVSRTVAMAA